MIHDIVQDQAGWFFHNNGDGTLDNLSGTGDPRGATTVLVRNGKATGNGDPLATRVAVVLARRYA